jgi:hypothetical protein
MPRGEGHYATKITDEDVREIRASFKRGVTGVVLAQHFGISRATVSLIVHRKRWSNVV